MIAFSASHKKQNCQIYHVDDDGNNFFCITGKSTLKYCQGLILSPDRRRLAFYSFSGEQLTPEYYAIGIDGSNLRPLPVKPSTNKIYSWLPDGRLFFISEGKYWTANPDGSEMQYEAFLKGYSVMDISLDGHHAVVTKGKSFPKQIFIADLDRRTIRPLSSSGTDIGKTPIQYPVNWSPDGRKIACVGGGVEDEIWVVNANGSHSHRVVESESFLFPFIWSPDSRSIAFVKQIVNIDAQEIREILCVVDVDNGNHQPIIDMYRTGGHWCWSKDGKSILYDILREDSLKICTTDMQGNNRILLDGGELGFDQVIELITT